MESSALDACVEYSFDGVSMTKEHLLNWKDTILEIIVVFVSTIEIKIKIKLSIGWHWSLHWLGII